MRRFLLLLLTILSSGAISEIYAQSGRLTAPDNVCQNAYASMHAFIDDFRTVDSVRWTIVPPTGPTYTHSRAMGAHPLFKYISASGQSTTFITDLVGTYSVTATIYYTSGGTQRSRTRTQTFNVYNCAMDKCEGTFTPSTNFKETFGQFYAGAPRRPVDPPATVGYTYEPTADLADDFYSIHYNSRQGGRPEWDNVGDHTDNGYGGMLIANSSDNPKLFYRRAVNGLCPGAKYNFSAWFINLNSLQVLSNTCQREDYRYAGVTFVVRNASTNAVIKQFNTNDVSMDLSRNLPGDQHLTGWQQFGGTVTLAPGQENVIVEIVNNNPGGCGNDIAVDDIEFVFCAPKIYSYIDGLGVSEDMVCPGAELTLTSVIEPSNYFANPVYRWEMNRNNTGWVTVGAPYTNFNTPVLNIPAGVLQELDVIEYRLMVFEAGNVNSRGCYTPSNRVLLSVPALPTINATRPAICRGDTTILRASPLESPSVTGYESFTFVGPRILTWPTVPAPKDSVMVDPIVTSVYNVRGGINYGRYANGTPRYCFKDASITITVDQPPVVNLGPDQVLCAGTPVTLDAGAANAAFPITWSPGNQTTQTINFPAPTPAAGVATLTNQYRVLVRNGECSVRDTVNITGVAPAVANINMPEFYCGVTAIPLKADAITADYTGLWTIVGASYGATISNPTLANGATLNNVPADQPITVRWTVSPVARPDCSSFEDFTVTSETRPTATVTGPFNQCSPTFQLSGNVPGPGMQGQWVVISGSATFDDPNSPTAIATVTAAGQVRVEWRVSRTNPLSVCTPATRQTTLDYTPPPLLNVTNVDINSCSNTNRFILPWSQVNNPTSYIIEAFGANPMPGFVTKSGSISGASGNITTAIPANTPAGTYTFRLTARKTTPPNCNGYTYFTVRIETPSTVPTITLSAPTICIGSSATLTANGTLGSGASWVWYQGGCGVGAPVGTGPSITVSPTAATTYYVRAESAMPCGNTTCASATVNVDQMPAAANAGPDQVHCNNATFNLNATAPALGTGTWTIPAGVTISSLTNRNAVATVPAGTTAILTWTVTNGTCTSAPDQVELTNRSAITGNTIQQDQVLCPGSAAAEITSSGTLAGGTGTYSYQWERSTTSASSGFTAIGGATGITFQPGTPTQTTWYRRIVTSDVCTSTSNVVEIRVNPVPVVTATNVMDACNASGKFEVPYTITQGTAVRYDLEAIGPNPLPSFVNISNQPIVSSPISINYPASTPAGTYNFRLVVRDAIGCQGETTFTVTLESLSTPSWIDATPARICIGQSVTLTARGGNLGSNAEWVWYKDTCGSGPEIGRGETITFTPTTTTTYAVRAESNRACKNSDCSPVTTVIVDQLPTVANAGPNQQNCNNTAFVMDANVPSIGTGSWTVPAGVTVSNINDPKATVNVPVGQTVTIYWTITNGVCVSAPSPVTLTNLNPVTNNVIAQDQVICPNTQPAQLTGVGAPTGGNGSYSYQWESSTTSATTGFTPVPSAIGTIFQPPVLSQTTWYRRIITSGACAAPSNVVVIRVTVAPPVVDNTPAPVVTECVTGTNYTALFGTPQFSHPENFALTITFSDQTTAQACGFIITRTWTATDPCGKSVSTSQTITVRDTKAPVLVGTPADTMVSCSAVPLQPDLTATDDCSAVTVTKAEIRTNGSCVNNYTLTRTWTATDACGNDTIYTQVVTVRDTSNPVILNVPADTMVSCSAVPPQPDLTATDNCAGAVTVTKAETRTNGTCANSYTLTRTWTATDVCGNDTTVTQVVTVRDTTAPVVTTVIPAARTVDCDAVPVQEDITATDNCSAVPNITVTKNEVRTNGTCSNTYTLTRTWVVRDECGNDTTITQVILVQDTTAPVFAIAAPADTTVDCNSIPAQLVINATDNCSATPNITVTRNEVRTNGSCANSYTLTRTWTAVDECGNDTTITQIIHVQDTVAPRFDVPVPADTTVDCNSVPTQQVINATDNCSAVPNITVTRNEVRTNGTCANSYTLTRTWTAVDECGNDTTITQVITVRDTSAPRFDIPVPADTTVDCNSVPAQQVITATDNCSAVPNITVTRNEVRTNGTCANSYTLTRTWTAVDECGNDTTITQIIHVQDTTAPVVTTVIPAARTVYCDAVPVQEDITATDNCSAVPNITVTKNEVRTNGACANSYTLTRTWIVRDECGNDTTITQVLTVQDTTAPVVTTVIPAARTVDCDAVPVQEDITATDNCSAVPNITVTKNEVRTNGTCANSYTLTRTWVVRDECGNDTTITQVLTVQDTTAPVVTTVIPAARTVDCDAVPVQEDITATDNCSAVPNITVTKNEVRTNGTCANSYTLTRTWVIRDECGNDTTITQVITVQDTVAPRFNMVAPADTTVDCNSVPAQQVITATDNCSATPNITVTRNEVRTNGTCPNTYILTRTWTAVDECGNDTTITQVINVRDTAAPRFDVVAPADTTVDCNSVPAQLVINATDNCSAPGNITITRNEVRTNGSCANSYTLTRTWTAVDECGNDTTITQVIHVQDTTAPVFSIVVPADTTVDCNSIPAQQVITATDNCSAVPNITVTRNEVRTNGTCANSYTLTRTWTAIDECGNDTTITQIIHVQDTTAPVVTTVIPAARTVDCDAVPVQEDITATDNCSAVPNITVTKNEVRTNGACANSYTLTRTWVVRDECGNDTTITQVLTVQDTTAPVVTTVIPAARTVDCDAVPVQEDITATDNCSAVPNITVTKNEVRTNGTCANSYTLTRTWVVRDECGNDTTITQVLTVQDTTAPVVTTVIPATRTVDCDAVPVQEDITATDNCSAVPNITVTKNEVRTNGTCASSYTLTRTWVVRDECGNDTTITQVLTVQDTTAPVVTTVIPAARTVDCDAVPVQEDITATDNCSAVPNITVTKNEIRTNGTCANSYTLTRTWVIRDECGNDTTITQVLNVQDTTAPVVTTVIPATRTVDCDAVPVQEDITATDNCSAVPNITVTKNEVRTNGTCANSYTLTRTWVIRDECGNDTTITQVLNVQDTTAPVVTTVIPAARTVDCDAVPVQEDITATDNCSAVPNITVTKNEVRTNGACANSYTLTRTWIVRDECGNDTTITQVVHVQDTTAPIVATVIPATRTVDCDAVPVQEDITATDNCSAVPNITVTKNEVRTNGTCANSYTLTRTWVVRDECGNDTTITQVLTVQDTTAPVVTTVIPATRTVDCDAVPAQEDITATDNCSAVPNITITKNEVRTNGTCANSYILTRTWIVRDECGNDTTITQVLTVQDTTAPVVTTVIPATRTVDCDAVPVQEDITATDNCSAVPNITVVKNEVRTNGTCTNTYTLTRTWVVSDECGNDTTITQVITVQDTVAPRFDIPVPADTTVDCNSVPTQQVINATDNCSATPNITVTRNEVRTNGTCANSYTLTRTWTAVDECGNDTTITQVITVRDTTAPRFDIPVPADTTVDCNSVPAQQVITATDNCSVTPNITVTRNEVRTNGTCANSYTLTRTWTAIDECGNDTTITQVITVRDTTAPRFDIPAPADTTVDCNSVPTQIDITATDNCSVMPNITVTKNEVRTNGTCANSYTLTRTWTAVDECGNDTTITQIIHVQDTVAPRFDVPAPADTTVDCNSVPTQIDITATDNCSVTPNITVTKNEVRTNGTCANSYTLTRTWTAVDECGNDTTITQIIHVQDTVAPRFDVPVPADTTVDCNSVPTQQVINATDNCSVTPNITVTRNEVRTNGTCANSYTLTRTWTAVDECGNDTTITQVITVRDTTAPRFDIPVPADTTVDCNSVPTQIDITATDNCSATPNITVTRNEVRTNGACANSYILTRTWTAVDECGNDTTITQVITVRDTTAPVVTTVIPATRTVDCDAVPVQEDITATDNCSAVPNITVVKNEVRTNGTCTNTYTLTRTWVVSDECGNDTTITQVITVQDTVAPRFDIPVPADTTVDCNSVPTQQVINATDNCSATPNITVTRNEVRTNGTCANSYTLTRTWTAVDECGNDTTITQVITVRDTTAPRFDIPVPADTTVDCNSVPTQQVINATDNCSATPNITVTRNEVRTNGTCANSYTLTRTWTAIDECGNDTTITQVITVRDTTAPRFDVPAPADTTVDCNSVPTQIDITATDNCSVTPNITVTKNEVRTNGTCANSYILTRTWTAVDECGNDTTITQIIHVQDTVAPRFDVPAPADTTVDCQSVPAQQVITATDNCSATSNITVTRNEVRTNGTCANSYILTRTWTAVDECGNDTTITQVVHVQDTSAPVILVVPADTTVNCDAVPAMIDLIATDNCNGPVTVTKSEIRQNGACDNSYILTRTWTATDACGNDSVYRQTVTVQDTTHPAILVVPADTTVNCDAVPAQPDLTATDNCSANVTVTKAEQRINGSCDNNYQLIRTWTATDACGNDTTYTQVVTVQDTTKPIFPSVPADTTVNCDNVPAQVTLAATDNCSGTVTVTMAETRVNGSCANSYQLIRTWTATDICGNDSTYRQVVTVQDTTKPVILNIPADTTVDCDAVPAQALLTGTDNCSGTVTITTGETRINGNCANNYQLIRTWTATDACGNDTTYTQVVTVRDTTNPVFDITAPADTTVSCSAVPVQADLTATDNCSGTVTVTKAEQRINGTCANSYQLIRTWTAVDACGNDTIYRQVITVVDTTRPVFTMPVPADTTVSCHAIPTQADLSVTDNCSPAANIIVLKNEVKQPIPGACVNNYFLIRTWTAMDECRNSVTVTQTITVVDTTRPTFTSPVPADITVECNAIPNPAVMTATDNCSTANGVTVNYTQTRVNIPGACANNYQLVRTWTATDECGNTNVVSQTITVQDTTAPVFTTAAPANATVECDMVPAQPDLTATDNCSANVTVTKAEQRINGTCANSYTLIRTWTATDECGNDTTITQTITVMDRTKPTFTSPIPADTTVNCNAIPVPPVLTASDKCSMTVGIAFNEQHITIPGACLNNYRLLRTWTATDECGNYTTVMQVVTVVDTTKPVFTMPLPANITVDCDAIPTQPDLTATDNCSVTGNVTITKAEQRINGNCTNNYQLIRTWTAIDECGNRAVATQVITVQDTTKPVFSMPTPADATVECNNIPAQPVLTATDNCSTGTINVVRSERMEQIPGAMCAGNYRLIRTWTATDECGNSTTVQQVLTVVDTTPPSFTMPVPADMTVDCNNIPAQPNLTATDNCTPTNRITVVKDQRREDIPGACVNNYRLIRTWTATDECGNRAGVTQVITVQDTTRPTFTVSIPADATVECSAIPAQPNLSVTDNCTPSNLVTVVKNERRENIPGACVNNYRLIRTWTATDECGNSRTVEQVLTVIDRTAPAFTISTPADATVECNAIPVQPMLTAMDNCSPASAVTVTRAERRENIPGACVNNYRLIRTWTATDECGNSRTVQQVITVQDTTKPVFSTTPPADITVECNAIPAQPDLTATDNCSAMNMVTIVKNEVRENIPGACVNNYRLIRTWTATDECGNSRTVRQVVTVQDKTAPVFNIVPPASLTVNCHEVPAAPVLTATDNCSMNNVTVVYSFVKTQLSATCVYNYRLDRMWTATDECGNKAIVRQVITVIDTTRPVFNAPTPRDTTVSCESIPNPQIVTASDNCSRPGGVIVTHKQTRQDIPGACKNYRLINTWTAKDECGNTSVITQVVTVVDTTRPVIAAPPADITIMCGAPIPTNMIELNATDNCDGTFPKKVKYTIDPYVKDLCNGYTIIRRWSVSDACGNAAQDVIQRIIVRPCPKPELEADVVVNCSSNPFITLRTRGSVNKPVYVLVGVTPANAVQVPLISTNNRFNLNGATTASFIVRDGITGCSSDTMTYNISYLQMPVVNLGNDTSICGSNGMVLDAGPANFGYQIRWSTGETTQRIRVVNPGTYKVTVSNGMCVTTDSIKVGVIPMPLVNLPDTTICRGQNVKLDATVSGASYLWSTGATTPSINVSTQERFWVRVMKNGCITIDTINVTVNPPPDISLSRDTTICPGQAVMLTVNTNAGRIQWGTGEQGNSIMVSKAGNYSVSVYRDNCVVKEFVRVSERPAMKFDLGPDRIMCPGGSILIDARNPDAASYRWNDGDTDPVKSITQGGKYIIGVLDRYCDRYMSDSINVVIAGPPTVNLGNDTTICRGIRFMLKSNARNATSYRWSTGATTSSIEITQPGTYSVTAYNDCGSTTDEITINMKECDSRPDFPNVFSPNGDGNNDVFRPVIRGPMYDYELRIFNRWGELVFISKDMHLGWDGTYKGRNVDISTFVWWLSYKKVRNGPAFVIKGDVTVIR